MTRIAVLVALLLLTGASLAWAQPTDYRVEIIGAIVRADGGETESRLMTGPFLPKGNPTAAVVSFVPGRCLPPLVSARTKLDPAAVGGWYVEIAPRAVSGNAMTFRLQWARATPGSSFPSTFPASKEMTLRPGESATIDVLPVPPLPAGWRQDCDPVSITLRMRAGYWPTLDWEDRIVSVELWLVEKQANGQERTEPVFLRGFANERIPFLFQRIVETNFTIDLFGHLLAKPINGGVEISLEPLARVNQDDTGRTGPRRGVFEPHGPTKGPYARKVNMTFPLKPEETVSIELPAIDLKLPDGTLTRQFAIRVRARQIR